MRIPLLAVAQREIPIPIVPPNFDSLVIFQLQCKLYNIDGTLSGLTADGGFRNYVCRNCREFGLRGFVWRVPKSDGKILASGTKVQFESMVEFLNNLLSSVSLITMNLKVNEIFLFHPTCLHFL